MRRLRQQQQQRKVKSFFYHIQRQFPLCCCQMCDGAGMDIDSSVAGRNDGGLSGVVSLFYFFLFLCNGNAGEAMRGGATPPK